MPDNWDGYTTDELTAASEACHEGAEFSRDFAAIAHESHHDQSETRALAKAAILDRLCAEMRRELSNRVAA